MKFRTRTWFISIVLSFLVGSFPLSAGEPTDQIRQAVDKGLQIVNDPGLQSKDKKKERNDRLRKIVYALFDFPEMAKRSLGPHWRRLAAKDQEEFVALFTELLEKTYADKVDLYNGEKVLYTREVQDNGYAEVASKVISKKGTGISVVYRCHRATGDWKIYDIVVENISLVNNYRAQFNRVLAKSSYDELIRMLRQKAG